MKRPMRTVYLNTEFEADELLDELKDEELAYELNKRGHANGAKEAVRIAIDQIRRGDHAEAITTLEREFMPRWQSTEDCRAAYAASKAA